MEDRARAERVEIELTANDDARRRWGRGGSADAEGAVAAPVTTATALASAGTSPAPASDSPAAFESADGLHSAPLDQGPRNSAGGIRRLAAIAAGTSAVALLLGWAIGRSGGGGETATSIAPATSQVAVSTSVAPGSTLPVVDPADLPTTTRPPRTTTTTEAPKWTIEPINIDGRAIELGLQLVGVTSAGRLFDIDAAAGTIASIARSNRTAGGAAVFAGEDWVMLGDFDRGQIELYRAFENTSTRLSIGSLWDLRWQPGTDRFWVVDQNYVYPGPMTIVERTLEGDETGTVIELSSRFWPVSADPAGGLIVSGQSGTFRVTPDGSERISTGSILAIGSDRALVVECGDSLDTCGTFVLDRLSGERTRLTVDGSTDPALESVSNYGMYGGGDLSRISPDGRYAPVVVPAPTEARFGVIDLETGSFTRLSGFVESGLFWTPDGSHAVYLSGGAVMVFDAERGESFPLLAPGPSTVENFTVTAITLRPPA